MKWDINLKRIVTDDYTDSLSIGLVFSGGYYLDEVPVIPIILAIDDTEQLSVKSYNQDGSSRIVLSGNKDYEANLLLDIGYAFSSISRESLEEADISNVNGEQIVVISSHENENLYENLLYRIAQSARVIIK